VLYLLLPIAIVVGWIEHPDAMCVLTIACCLWRRQIKRSSSKCLWR
jgi:4-amino-4-deoxy-L-arabinose transferase-like glycosyltransferase